MTVETLRYSSLAARGKWWGLVLWVAATPAGDKRLCKFSGCCKTRRSFITVKLWQNEMNSNCKIDAFQLLSASDCCLVAKTAERNKTMEPRISVRLKCILESTKEISEKIALVSKNHKLSSRWHLASIQQIEKNGEIKWNWPKHSKKRHKTHTQYIQSSIQEQKQETYFTVFSAHLSQPNESLVHQQSPIKKKNNNFWTIQSHR